MRLDAEEGVQAASVGFPERGFITRSLAPVLWVVVEINAVQSKNLSNVG